MKGFEPSISGPPDQRFTGLSYIPKKKYKRENKSEDTQTRTVDNYPPTTDVVVLSLQKSH